VTTFLTYLDIIRRNSRLLSRPILYRFENYICGRIQIYQW